MAFNGHTIIDGDGHVIEDCRAIINYMPQPYRDKYETHSFFNPFPPLDHLHSSNLHDFQPGAFNQVGPDGWVDFLEDVGIETTVLYTTLGLAFGGTDYDKQRAVLSAGVDVLIGTPGRIIDFYKQRVFGLPGTPTHRTPNDEVEVLFALIRLNAIKLEHADAPA